MGDAADVAARLPTTADPCQIVTGAATWRATRSSVPVQPLGDLTVKAEGSRSGPTWHRRTGERVLDHAQRGQAGRLPAAGHHPQLATRRGTVPRSRSRRPRQWPGQNVLSQRVRRRETARGTRTWALLGELSAVDRQLRSATVQALDHVTAPVMPLAAFEEYLQQHGRVAFQLMRLLVERLRDAARKRIEFGAQDSTGRVATRLMELAGRFGTPIDGSIHVAILLSQDELAGWIGPSRKAVTKSVRVLRDGRLDSHQPPAGRGAQPGRTAAAGGQPRGGLSIRQGRRRSGRHGAAKTASCGTKPSPAGTPQLPAGREGRNRVSPRPGPLGHGCDRPRSPSWCGVSRPGRV